MTTKKSTLQTRNNLSQWATIASSTMKKLVAIEQQENEEPQTSIQ